MFLYTIFDTIRLFLLINEGGETMTNLMVLNVLINNKVNARMPKPIECLSCPVCYGDCRIRTELAMKRAEIHRQVKEELKLTIN